MYQTALPDYSRRVQQLAFTESPVIVLAQARREGSDLHFVVQESWRNRTGRPLPVPIGRVIPQLSMPAGSADDIDGAIVFFRRQNESTDIYRHLAIFNRNGRTKLAIPHDWLDYLTLGYRQHTTARIKNYVLSLLPASTP
jgi:hypothetical protein